MSKDRDDVRLLSEKFSRCSCLKFLGLTSVDNLWIAEEDANYFNMGLCVP